MRPIGNLRRWIGLAGLAMFAAAGAALAADQTPKSENPIEQAFRQPPDSARPWVYWFWLNGNLTREGITADLESMRRVGVGGVLIMEVDQGAPLGPVGFMSDRWRELFKFMVAEAQRLGLEVNMNDDAGWNGSGGPWIKPELSMQKVVAGELHVSGPKHVETSLAQPETVAGFYRDIAVLAFPTPGDYRIPNIKVKAAYEVGQAPPVTEEPPKKMVIDRPSIVDLTSRMDPQGKLVWDAPPGQWTVLRLGRTSTGARNAPAPASGCGLECDKLSKEGVEANFNGMIARLVADVGPAAGKTLVATHVDSWENGSQNWTARMREEFRTRRGYDLLLYLPVMTGRVVGGIEQSERFLWDLRRTISELVVENYAGHLHQLARQHGLRFTIEAYGGPCDNLPYGGQADEPMGEFWVGGGAMNTVRGMASAAHIYGKRIVGAESFTAGDQERWRDHPATIKSLGDEAFCEGINRFVFHRFAMQPWLDRRPGMTMGPWGTHFERTETWWELTPGWHRYLARCQHLLRLGRYVADICYLEPEDSPRDFSDHPRQGYPWDQCCKEALASAKVGDDGRLLLGNMNYRLLALSDARRMTPALLVKVKSLVEAGATVVGPKPLGSPSLSDYPQCDEEVRRLAGELWGNCDGAAVQEHRLGKGRIVWGQTPEKVLAQSGVRPDFSSPARLRFIHRQICATHVYFVSNPARQSVATTAAFRVKGMAPMLWWPDTGRIEPAAMYHQQDGTTQVALNLEPSGSVFVVFPWGTPRADPAVALTRAGQNVASIEQAIKIVVQKAVYGVPDDPRRTRDVAAEVRKKVAHRDYTFPVAEMAVGGDPARESVKTLVVDYTIGDRRFSVRARDGENVTLSGEAVRATIDKAVYGVPGDAKRTRDVRAHVQRIIDAGGNNFQVALLADGDDPAFGVVKTVVIDYTCDGKHLTAAGTDPETISLGATESSQPAARLQRGAKGQLLLEAWQPGPYEVRFASGRKRQADVMRVPATLEVAGPWEVAFPASAGLASPLVFDRLVSWSDRPEQGAKYFSGTAVYRAALPVPSEMPGKDRRLYLDLGDVQAFAEVKVNGRELGVLWKPPFVLDATGVLVAGENRLEIRVTNLWPNRMIGDEWLPEDSQRNADGTLKQWPAWLQQGKPSPTGRQTFTTWRLWKKGDSLLRSGLLGPVRIVPSEQVTIE